MATVKKEKGKYSKALVAKVIKLLQYWISYYMTMAVEDIKMTFSMGNMKIGRVLNVSLAPIITCKNCAKCMYWCYDLKTILAYPSCLLARARNTALFLKDRNEFFNRLWAKMAARKKNFFLRFHVSGEIVDIDHFARMIETARRFPNYVIWTYTKMYAIINLYCDMYGKESIPDNFHVMFSEWDGMPMDNKYNFPVFRCAFRKEQEIGFKCPGNCDYCKEHKTGCVAGQSAYTLPH